MRLLPSFIDPRDVVPQGDPETAVSLPTNTLMGLYIRGLGRHVILGIREDAEGQPVTCAVTNELYIDTSRSLQSNPRRPHGSGAVRDDNEDGA